MAAVIWMSLAAAWIWHVVDFFCEVDASELPVRARHWIGDPDANERQLTSLRPRREGT